MKFLEYTACGLIVLTLSCDNIVVMVSGILISAALIAARVFLPCVADNIKEALADLDYGRQNRHRAMARARITETYRRNRCRRAS